LAWFEAAIRSVRRAGAQGCGNAKSPQKPRMILVDGGPLVAIADADDQHHSSCKTALASLREPLGTVWPVLAEAMYLLTDLPDGQNALWEMIARGAVALLPLDFVDVPRIRELMGKYSDRGMDLADAALIRVAER